ncbi:MAG: hypothetical protein NC313_08930 [Butyrivibrio sp.]|nr:hypothetical protein [Butyrivibrio sp.]
MEKKAFLQTIRTYCRKINLARFVDMALLSLCVGAGVGIILQAAALIVPIYYVNLYTVIALFLAIFSAAGVMAAQHIDMKHAALIMDSFGFGERIVTAYENMDEDGEFIRLQREDAMHKLNGNRDKIHIPLFNSWKKPTLFALMCALLVGLAFIPSASKERAQELHAVRQASKEKTKEIKKTVEDLKQLGQDELSAEQQAMIQEMIESLESSMSEYQQASSAEAVKTADEKLNYKYNDMGNQLSAMAQSLQNAAEVSPVTAQAMQAMAKKMQEMSGEKSPGEGELAQSQGGNKGQNGNGQNDGNQGGNGQNGNGAGSKDGNGQNGGQDGDGQGGSGQNGSGQNGDGQSGNGQGNDGEGGNGSGRGTGSSDTPRDYVSVPNEIADSENLTGSSVDHEESEFFRAPNGLSWEGEHISHDAVIGSYEQNAYEGIAAGKYPSGMEDVIKDYFSSFN